MPLFYDKSSLVTGKQAQQSYRFVLNVKGIDVALIQGVTAPKYKITTTSYDFLDYKFHYPQKVEWQSPISFEILQILDNEAITSILGYFMSKLNNSAYYASPMGIGTGERDLILPNSLYTIRDSISNISNNGFNTGYDRTPDEGTVLDLSKQKLSKSLGKVEIKILDEEGKNFESWRLNNAFIIGITPTDLSYKNETLSTIKVDIQYDWASYGFRGVYAEEDSVMRVFGI